MTMSPSPAHEHHHATAHRTLVHHVVVQAFVVIVFVALVLWAVLFANYPAVHDPFHELRHALYIVPCH